MCFGIVFTDLAIKLCEKLFPSSSICTTVTHMCNRGNYLSKVLGQNLSILQSKMDLSAQPPVKPWSAAIPLPFSVKGKKESPPPEHDAGTSFELFISLLTHEGI